jgi:ATP-dependent helicase Lhr and Lhr-like helicase
VNSESRTGKVSKRSTAETRDVPTAAPRGTGSRAPKIVKTTSPEPKPRAKKTSEIDRLFPPLAAWFWSKYPDLSEAQKKALPHTLIGKNTLILAPTGSGKTLSAFLSTLSNLAVEAAGPGLPNAIRAIYVSPLRSLGRDIHRNLEEPLEAINAALPFDRRIRMEVRTGDTELSERARQSRLRPHLLLTTPESLSALLSQVGFKNALDVRTVIVDEVHSFAENKRGSLLALSLERLEEKGHGRMQRLGLSATAYPVEVVAQLLCGDRHCEIASVDIRKAHKLEIAVPEEGQWLPPAGYNPYRIAPTVADLVAKAKCSLIFVTTRSAAERLGLALKILLPEWDEKIEVHHSSVERNTRLAIEEGLSQGTLKAVVASSSLELGVDFQAVDQVLLIGTPRGVSRALQRLGRSGHRVGGVATGSLVPLSLPDVLQAIALRHTAQEGHLDALRVPSAPLDVLAQALLGMSIERPWKFDEAYELVKRAGPYANLPREDFDSVIDYLCGGGRVLSSYGTYGKILVEDGKFRVASRKAARDYYMNVGTISDDFQMRIVSRTNQRLGEVEEAFIASLQPGEAFTIGGKVVAVDRIMQNIAVVKPAQGERVQTPRWMGNKMPLTARLAAEELKLRRDLREAWESSGPKGCEKVLRTKWKTAPEVIARALTFIERQYKAAPIPLEAPQQVERVREGRSLLTLFHVLAGRAVNRSLAWVIGYRLGDVGSIVANHDDHAFLLALSPKRAPGAEQMREAFNPKGFVEDLRGILAKTEMLGRGFRPVAETGQLLPRRTYRGPTSTKSAAWNGSLLYSTLLQHEPDHPLLRETVRGVMEDQMDVEAAVRHAARIYDSEWEVFDLPRPSPFGLPLFAAFSRETLLAQDPERALDELVEALYESWAVEAETS